jgi:hypothetical protein
MFYLEIKDTMGSLVSLVELRIGFLMTLTSQTNTDILQVTQLI